MAALLKQPLVTEYWPIHMALSESISVLIALFPWLPLPRMIAVLCNVITGIPRHARFPNWIPLSQLGVKRPAVLYAGWARAKLLLPRCLLCLIPWLPGQYWTIF